MIWRPIRQQMRPFRDAAIEQRFHAGIASVLRAHDAPPEFYRRYGVQADAAVELQT